jgi:hypothetical protein
MHSLAVERSVTLWGKFHGNKNACQLTSGLPWGDLQAPPLVIAFIVLASVHLRAACLTQ